MFDNVKLNNTTEHGTGIFENTIILKLSDNCTIDDSIDDDYIKSVSEFIKLKEDNQKLTTENSGLKTENNNLMNQISSLKQSSNISSSESMQKLLLLLLLNKSDSDLTNNINRLLRQ